ncbi:hypothetical protein ACFYMW_25625 [Streptomyces sp. NPDC006692]|uniref:hypothetical protein n=1 Tax=unclassified Streptomyces TaxID=2593676 RepID=UPI00343A895B
MSSSEVSRMIMINTPEGPVLVPASPVLTQTVDDLPSLLIWFALTFQDAEMEARNSEAEATWIQELEGALTRFEQSMADDKVPATMTATIADLRAKMRLLHRAHRLQHDMAKGAARVSRGSAYHARDTYLGMWESVVVARGLVAENTHFNG